MTYIYHGGRTDSKGGHKDKKTEVIITITESLRTTIQMVYVSMTHMIMRNFTKLIHQDMITTLFFCFLC